VNDAETSGDLRADLLAIYDRAIPQVYGYLVTRVGNPVVAEDLTADTFLAAADAIERGTLRQVSVAWLVTVARNKLVDHWRRLAREQRQLHLIETNELIDDGIDLHLDRVRARSVLAQLGAHHRSALTLRYLDGLPVPEVADHLVRTVHATEALLVRARNAFRVHYQQGGQA
jgi:RNA polymerase sigma-70 factor, ECF subfamily